MHKKGDITFRYLVLLILALIALVVIIIMFTKGFDYLFEQVRWALGFVFDLKPKGM